MMFKEPDPFSKKSHTLANLTAYSSVGRSLPSIQVVDLIPTVTETFF